MDAPAQSTLTIAQAGPNKYDGAGQLQCGFTQLSWTAPESCSPIVEQHISCKDSNGVFQDLPGMFNNAAEWRVADHHFTTAPFNLSEGGALVCQIRTKNALGFSPFSPHSVGVIEGCPKAPVAAAPAEVDDSEPVKCGFACALRKQNICNGRNCGDRLERETLVNAANAVIQAKNQEFHNWLWDKSYGPNQACCLLPFFNKACDCGCECAGRAGCGCDKTQKAVTKPALPVTHKHSYKAKPQWKEEKKVVEWQEMVPKVEWRPVEEHFKKTIMVDKVVETPVTTSHAVKRTIKVPENRPRTEVKVVTECETVKKVVVVPIEDKCACFNPKGCGCAGQAGCGCSAPTCGCTTTKTTHVPSCKQVEKKVSTPFTVMVDKEITVQVPTTYTKKETVKVPKVVDETRTIQKAFDVEVPVTRTKTIVTRVYVPQKEEKFYEHQHVGGGEEHVHGSAFIAKEFRTADPCSEKAKECHLFNEVAIMATDGKCYCTKATQ